MGWMITLGTLVDALPPRPVTRGEALSMSQCGVEGCQSCGAQFRHTLKQALEMGLVVRVGRKIAVVGWDKLEGFDADDFGWDDDGGQDEQAELLDVIGRCAALIGRLGKLDPHALDGDADSEDAEIRGDMLFLEPMPEDWPSDWVALTLDQGAMGDSCASTAVGWTVADVESRVAGIEEQVAARAKAAQS